MRKMDLLYAKVNERPGHALGMAPLPEVAIAIACSCGFEDTWQAHERIEAVVRRFNRHLPREAG